MTDARHDLSDVLVADQTAYDVGDEAELRELLGGEPSAAALRKQRDRLDPLDLQWLSASPFCLIATADSAGRCDVSPKGDPAGFTVVLNERTIALPERPGNRRADGLRNVLDNPRVGLIYLLPGRGDTLRINGRARIVRNPDLLDRMIVRGHRPVLALLVEIEEVFHHCQKAFLRSHLWDPASWQPDAVPSRAHIAHRLERPDRSVAELECYYGPSYADNLYGSG